ncbi:MAG: acetylhydrolase [Candidatus Accumulibacter sp.]|uniref:Acetylhydrolase n=1 Tax=Candidatus Accumulibacter proximus TaxID=2954385 RepID=A0A935UGM3_9PROT|nr:acetylhydrolase [Candidatus Accumulibacter proximus]
MKLFKPPLPGVSPDPVSLFSRRESLPTAAAAGAIFALLLLASARLAAQGVEAPQSSPVVVAASEQARDTAVAEVISHDYEWHDASRNRAVPVRLYLPAATAGMRTLPLVVFSHGIGGSRRGYSYLGAYWASQGYASLHLQHVGSDRSLWTGNVFNLVGRLQGAAQEEEAIARVGDLRFALDQLLSHPEVGQRIDPERIVAAGHSYGANTILLALGARIERHGRIIDLAEPRLKAAMLLSAPPFYGETDIAKILSGIRVPTLHITATEDIIRIPGYYSGADDRIAVFEAMPGVRKVLAVFAGGSHSMFTDRAATGGVTLNPLVKAATRELSVAFWQKVFGGDDAALRDWPARHNSIVARFVAGGS